MGCAAAAAVPMQAGAAAGDLRPAQQACGAASSPLRLCVFILLPPLPCLHQAVLDAYLCLVHLTLGIMVESLFRSFGTVAFMQFGAAA